MQTLAQLKAENAAAEAAEAAEAEETETPPQEVEEETEEATEAEAVEVEAEETEEGADPGEDETGETETEAWMQGDDQTSDAEKKFTDNDIGAAKKKLRAKLEGRHNDEVDQLKAQIKQLEQGKPKELSKPKREDFFESEDPEEAYIDALTDYKINKSQAESQASTATEATRNRQAEVKRTTDTAVDQHYLRAEKLADKSGISDELYKSSDLKVRNMIESLYPKAGDKITDELIASLGDGSEKVFFSVGVKDSRLAELKSRLEQDPSGIKAGMYLGQLNAELSAPQKRKTKAPAPATQIKGDANTSAPNKALKKKYDAAHKKGDGAAAYKIKRAAKKTGADTKDWAKL